MSNINVVHKNLDFNTTILGILENTDSKIRKFRIKLESDLVISKIAIKLYKELEKTFSRLCKKLNLGNIRIVTGN